jgi:hypothetical protein
MICRRDRAGKPIQLNDDENVAISDKLQRRLELESHSGRSDLFPEDLFAARR